jgi:hypothetical protein
LAHDEHCLVLSKHTELGDAPGLLSHGDRTGNWASRRAATRRCCLPPGQMQSGSWRAGAGHRSGTARRRLTRHRWPSVPGPMRERSRETDEHKGEEDRASGPRTSAARRWTCCLDLRTSTSAGELRTNTEEHEQRNRRSKKKTN